MTCVPEIKDSIMVKMHFVFKPASSACKGLQSWFTDPEYHKYHKHKYTVMICTMYV
jgi:hypothetical protein